MSGQLQLNDVIKPVTGDAVKKGLFRKKIVISSQQIQMDEEAIISRMNFQNDKNAPDYFVIMPYEHVVIIVDGVPFEIKESGTYEILKKKKWLQFEIIWLKKSEINLKWGAGDFLSSDGEQFGSYGIARVQILKPRHFMLRILGGGSFSFTDDDLKNFIRADLINTSRNSFLRFSLAQIRGQNKILQVQVKAALTPTLRRWGLELLDFQIIGFRFRQQ